MVETVTNKPYTSRSLLQCIDRGAELFRWSERTPHPASMRSGDDLVGFGYATAFYPAQMAPAECRITLGLDLRAKVEIGAHEIGTGVWTVLTQTAADLLGLPISSVEVVLGDSSLPAAPLAAGSNSTASVCNVVALACEKVRARLARNASVTASSPLYRQPSEQIRLVNGQAVFAHLREPLTTLVPRAFRNLPLTVKASNSPHGAPPLVGPALVRKGKPLLLGGSNLKDRMQFAFGAQFVEVRVDRHTGQVRVPRAVGVFACGRIMNRRTAHAQLQGGQIWGISSALHEASEVDIPTGRFVNQNLAEYHVPVAADIGDITTEMLDEVDTKINALGIKGVGEIGITGMNAAIANAVFHATGTRLRKLPIRPGDLTLGSL
jgi:xanthine dehydrogenase YagR molybdenum-binding subunit